MAKFILDPDLRRFLGRLERERHVMLKKGESQRPEIYAKVIKMIRSDEYRKFELYWLQCDLQAKRDDYFEKLSERSIYGEILRISTEYAAYNEDS